MGLEEPLQKIGLTEGEIKVYLALLHTGTETAGPIAKEARVARSKSYDILDRLAKKGLVSHAVENGVKNFSPAQPSRLLDFLRQKEEELESHKEEIKEVLPRLEKEYELQNVHQKAEVFEGLEGLKNAREKYIDLMEVGESIYFFGVPSSAYDRMEAYYADWNQRRIDKGVKSYTVFTNEARGFPYVREKKEEHEHTFVRFLPPDIMTHAWTEIYRDTVVIAINYKKPMSIVIKNKYVADSYKEYFDVLWRISEE